MNFYLVRDAVTIVNGVTLTIEPRVTVKFRKDLRMYLNINGTFIANGVSSQMIRFTSNESSPVSKDWGNVWIRNTGSSVIY